MDPWLLGVLQWLHIFFAIFWFGSVLAGDFIVLPTMQSMTPAAQEAFFRPFVDRAAKVVVPVAAVTILLGLTRGIAGGVLGNLGSLYGLTWVAALVVGTSLLYLGAGVITPVGRKLQQTPQGPDFDAGLARLKRLTLSELGGFMLILTFMIAMRFGY
jgi:hypothetical protein